MADSNYDWGQGLPELRAWQIRARASPLEVWYFGTEVPLAAAGFTPFKMDAGSPTSVPQFLARARGKYIAVSTSFLYDPNENLPARYLREKPPLARTMTYFIYDFTRGDGT